MRHQAIYNLYPNVVTISEKDGAFDSNGNLVIIDDVIVTQEVLRLEQEYQETKYKILRARAYPPLEDLADAIYWQTQGNTLPMTAYIAACAQVKLEYPKG